MTFAVNRVLGTADSQVPIKGEKNQKKKRLSLYSNEASIDQAGTYPTRKKKIAYLHVLLREKCVLTLHIHC